jgi:CHASE1-domain containing sensor protein
MEPFPSPEPVKTVSASKRILLVLVVIAVGATLGLTAFFRLQQLQRENVETEFYAKAFDLSLVMERGIQSEVEILYSMRGLFDASDNVSRDEFLIFVDPILTRHANIQALEWIPKIATHERGAYVDQARSDGLEGFSIRELGADGNMAVAGERDFYYPVYYVEPLSKNKKAVGFDLASNERRRMALDQARDTRDAVATARITLVQESSSQAGFLIFLPVFMQGDAGSQNNNIGSDLRGFVLGVYRIGDLAINTLGKLSEGTDVTIFDASSSDVEILYTSLNSEPDLQTLRDAPLQSEFSFDVAGREWVFIVTPGAGFDVDATNYQSWLLLVMIFGFSALSAGYLNNVLSSRNTIAERVDEQLATIRANEKKLIQINGELEEFAYRTSHDLRSPIVSSNKLLEVVADAIEQDKKLTAIQGLAHARNSLRTLETLISDILTLTEVGNINERETKIEIPMVVDDVLSKIQHVDGFDRLTIAKDLQVTSITAMPSRFGHIVENLISNAIKYQDPEEAEPFVKISTKSEGSWFVLEVEDNGLGISEKFRDKLFKMFKRFHPNVSVGSGLGLYMIKKSAEILGGEITYEGEGKGSLFRLTLPSSGV